MSVILALLYLVQGQILEYRLWKNYGQVIYDYSENKRHGNNGQATTSDSFDCLFTDRGVYLSKNCMIRLPNFGIPNPVSLVLWVLPDDIFYTHGYHQGIVFCRWSQTKAIFISHYKPTSSVKLKFHFGIEYYLNSPNNSWKTSKFYIDEWVLIIFEINQNIIKIKNNDEVILQHSHPSNFDDSLEEVRYIHIGTDNYDIPGIGGFVWYFAIFTEVNIESQFLSTSSNSCFEGSCSDCNPSFVIPSLGTGCASNSVSTSTDSNGNVCSSGYGCKGSSIIKCNCPSKSCEFSSEEVCSCIDSSSGSTYQSSCSCISGGQGCCRDDCDSCSVENKCLTCKSNFSTVINGVCSCKGGYYKDSSTSSLNCLKCLPECNTCSTESFCTSCIDNNAEIINGICSCIYGYFSSIFENNSICLSCLPECRSCENSSECLECKDINAILNAGRCICMEGYYLLEESKECMKCENSCLTCSGIGKCSVCTSLNTEIVNGVCVCKEGYWAIGEINSFDSCKACQAPCKSCKNLEYCLTCEKENYKAMNGKCLCPEEFYEDEELCKQCNIPCETCKNSTYCLSCTENYYLSFNGTCKCVDGFYQNNSSKDFQCEACIPPCKKCKSLNECLDCNDTKKILDDQNNCVCIDKYFMDKNGDCISCNETCANCSSKDQCLACADETFEFLDSQKCLKKCPDDMIRVDEECICQKGLKEKNSSCVEYFFYLTLNISKSNKILLVFSEPLKSLSANQISITFQKGRNQKFQLYSRSSSEYIINFQFTESISNNTKITLKLKQSIYSIFNASLKKYKYKASLSEYLYIDPKIKNLIEKSSGAIKIMATTSIGFIFISNPAASWALIGTLQLLPYIPLSSNYDENVTRLFFTSVGAFNVLPNFLINFFSEDSASEPSEEIKSAGIKTSVFWINVGKIVLPFIILIILWPFILVLSKFKLGKFSLKFEKLLENYRYSVFIKFWIQAYIDLAVFSIIALKASLNHSAAEFYFNKLSADLTMFLVASTPEFFAFLLFCIYHEISEEAVVLRYGTLFSEFKNDKGFLSVYFYVFYFARRLQFVLTQLFLNVSGLAQAILNMSSGILMIFYMLKYRPFIDIYSQISNLVTEITFSLIFICFLIFSTSKTLISDKIYQNLIIFIVISCISIQYIISLIVLLLKLKEFYFKLEDLRNKLIPDQIKPVLENID